MTAMCRDEPPFYRAERAGIKRLKRINIIAPSSRRKLILPDATFWLHSVWLI